MFHRKSMIRSAGLLILALAVALSFSGCGKKSQESGPDSLINASKGSENSESLSAEKEGVSFEAELSYANYNYIETGDESEDKLIRNVKQTLSATDSDEKLQIEAVVKALKTVPKGLSDAETFVSDDITVNSMKFSGSSLIIDLSSDGLDELGMYDEKFFIYQVTDSILNTFPDLEGVRFTVDGTKKDSMNYIDISSAFTASDVKAFLKGSSDDSEEEKETSSAAKATQENTTKKGNSQSEDSQKEDSDSSKSSSQTNKSSSSTSGSSSPGSQSSQTKKNTSSDNTSSTSSGSNNNSTSGNQSSASGSSSSGNNSTSGSKKSSSSSSNSTGSSGSQSSSSGSSSSGSKSTGSSGSQSSSSGSSGTSSSGSSSAATQDGVVNDEDL